jgi:phosphopantetheinyl transferase
MGNLPQIKPSAAIPIQLSTPAYLMDHHFQGRPVLPAVEAMETLARVAKEDRPDLVIHQISNICFDKFLYLDPTKHQLDAMAELKPAQGDDGLHACLITRSQAPGAAITRTKVHARLTFSQSTARPVGWPMDVTAVPEGICVKVPPERLYSDLVPFGPAFQNIVAPVWISRDGALACIRTPDIAYPGCLGSPFTLDAAMHAACAWSQYYQGIVAFPVAMENRTIFQPTLPNKIYYGRIRPQAILDDLLIVDMELLDAQGGLCESILGVHMRDVSGGRLKPPPWFVPKAVPDPLVEIGKQCLGLAVVETDAAASFAPGVLTPLEIERFDKMGPRRRKSFLAARLALKRLYRQCQPQGRMELGDAIETVCKDSPLPCCNALNGSNGFEFKCSVSHDRRLAIAVAHSKRVGVDVEELTKKALKYKEIFMCIEEMQLVRRSHLENHKAALYVWSIKEAAAKAFGMNLAEVWQAVQVTDLDDVQSRFELNARPMVAYHAEVDNHVVTLVADI